MRLADFMPAPEHIPGVATNLYGERHSAGLSRESMLIRLCPRFLDMSADRLTLTV